MAVHAKSEDKECCRVEALIGVDDRGQMVLPKEVREAAGIRPGDKLALILWRKEEKVCCMTLIKADDLTGMVRGRLGPLMKDIID
ncbi:MAG TPA: HgcAB-associated protein [Terriglobales bacterium]|nr:HgcAB-associated protein [Terriglobales bacterium]